MDVDARAFGQLEGEVKALHSMMAEQNKTLATLTAQLDQVSRTLSEAKGSWRTIMLLGGMVATVASALTWLLTHLPFRG